MMSATTGRSGGRMRAGDEGLPRRAAMRAALGALATSAFAPIESAEAHALVPPAPFALAPDWTTNWVVHKDPLLGASVTQLANGVILKASPYVYNNDDLYLRSNIVLWSKVKLTGDFKMTFSFTRLDNTVKTTGKAIRVILYFHALGAGDSAHPESFAQWPSQRPFETDYVRYSKGLRVTWSNFSSVFPDTSDQ